MHAPPLLWDSRADCPLFPTHQSATTTAESDAIDYSQKNPSKESTAGCGGLVNVVAFDCPESIINDVKGGNIDLAICQRPAEMGQVGVEYMVKALNGEKVPARYGTGYFVIDKKNADSAEAKAATYASK